MNEIKQKIEISLQKAKEDRAKKEKYIYYIKYIGSIILPALIVAIVLSFIIGVASVKGSSMEKDLHDNDIVVFNRLDTNIERFDIIVATKDTENIGIIKRVIGLPNETVEIVNGYVYINNILLDESLYTINGTTELQDVSFPIKLKDDEYLCLGDNRPNSLDSRNSQTGLINKKDIFGIVFFVLRGIK